MHTPRLALLVLVLALLLSLAGWLRADPGPDPDPPTPTVEERLQTALQGSPWANQVHAQLAVAGENGTQLVQALLQAPDTAQRTSVAYLIAFMPARDAKELKAGFILENVAQAHRARAANPWAAAVPDDVFRNDVLPYATLNERRDNWRKDFCDRFAPMVKDCKTLTEAFVAVAGRIQAELKVSYNTKRKKPDQSPYESMEQGMATCTGLAVLLVDALRSVGVPARIAGVPQWTKVPGNHTWNEVWIDGEWKFTEYGGTALNSGWFLGRTGEADATRRATRVYATSFQPTGDWFPLPWDESVRYVNAFDVTTRYHALAHPAVAPAATSEVRVAVLTTRDGDRVVTPLRVLDAADRRELATGETRGPENDLNDMATFALAPGADIIIEYHTPDGRRREHKAHTADAGAVLTVVLLLDDPADIPEPRTMRELLEHPGSDVVVPLAEAAAKRAQLWEQYVAEQRADESRKKELTGKQMTIGDAVMRYEYYRIGEKPAGGYPLYIALHGGGGAPAAVNDSQWEHMKIYYRESVKVGIYVAPRGMTNTWNLHFVGPSYRAYDRLIENMILFEDVDPDRCYILGFSAGGDGAYQAAPRMADRWAGANASAGHPNGVQVANLFNVAFLNQVGERDEAYGRHRIAPAYGRTLDALQAAHPEGYVHQTFVHANRPHNFADNDPRMRDYEVIKDPVAWLEDGNRETVKTNTNAIAWLREHVRNPLPDKIVWQPEVNAPRAAAHLFYWLDLATADIAQTGSQQIVARLDHDANAVIVESSGSFLRGLLSERMLDLSKPVTIRIGGQVLSLTVEPRLRVMLQSMLDRGDPRYMFDAAVTLRRANGLWTATAE
ncbi:MAG: transglutaminase domain-containing protein [Planctomycetota bacterium]